MRIIVGERLVVSCSMRRALPEPENRGEVERVYEGKERKAKEGAEG